VLEIRPFAGLLYGVTEEELGRVLCPPYDVITPEAQADLYARDPRNIVRVVLNRNAGGAAYREAGETFARWRAEGLLRADPVPALYLLEQAFDVEGREAVRRGLLARFRAEDPETGSVLPHEQTRPGPREDRYRVLVATRANFSPIFLMFADRDGTFAYTAEALAGQPPALTFADEAGTRHRLWRVTDAEAMAGLSAGLRSTPAYIADGHHRYATALRYRDERGPEGAWTLGYFTPLEGPGLVVLPYHRVVREGPGPAEARRALAGGFRLHDVADAPSAARAAAASHARYAFGLAWAEGGALLAEAGPEAEGLLPPGTPPALAVLDVFLLHQAVLGSLLGVGDADVRFVHSLAEAEEALRRREARLAVLLRPTPVRQVVDVAEARLSMPAKSTFFYPKLPSGLVIHPLPA
jgi:uncharacterized protein (DUF1015 family)